MAPGMRLEFIVIICLFLFSIAIGVGAQTEDRAGFAVTMESQRLMGRPGGTLEGSFRIIATRTKDISRYELGAFDLVQTVEGVVHQAEPGAGKRSCAAWVDLPESVEIPAGGGDRRVAFSIRIPPEAEGAYYSFIGVSLMPTGTDESLMSFRIQPSLSLKIELEIAGSKSMALDVRGITFEHDLGAGHPGFVVELENTGNIKTSFEGDVIMYKNRNRFPLRAEIQMGSDGNPPLIYPGYRREMRCRLTEVPTAGDYRAEVRLRLAGRWRARSIFDITVPPRGSAVVAAASSGLKSEFDVDVRVEPGFVEVTLPPGASRVIPIWVENRDSMAIAMRARVSGVIQERNGFLTYSAVPDSIAEHLSVAPAELTLRPFSKATLKLTVGNPAGDYLTGNLYAVRINGAAGRDESDWVSEVDMGVPIVIIPAGSEPARLEITELREVRLSDDHNPTAAIVLVENKGGRVVQLKGVATLERASSGEKIQQMHFSEVDKLILPPGTKREFRIPLPLLDRDRYRLAVALESVDRSGGAASREITFTCSQGPGGN